ncbi:hypothetical protein BTO20_25915 [Mycobacterium dioxanotrophicus]|uniref:Transmembrane protein n=1 Tax=Mycobacterium dioxanotrophicus TaxID=482462 RepID=A0A1Y0C8F1_9MYCO|nr:hypothetical protein [Mycobacterium dioxanotrophicus]ART71528.1 hypothetical protein BTO20_25915 [Mycobacterium dioxanotrophicus]
MAGDAFMDTLRTIEGRVLDEVWMGRWRFAAGVLAVLVLVVGAVTWWCVAESGAAHSVPMVGLVMFALAGAASSVALARRRYRWCCAAAYLSGLATVVGVGALWWLRTGHHATGLGWLVAADLAVMALAGHWLALVFTPIEQSQPDMRTGGR